nr:MAG TPA: hypothetical protein [Caudoviricetes sp.]
MWRGKVLPFVRLGIVPDNQAAYTAPPCNDCSSDNFQGHFSIIGELKGLYACPSH